MEAWERFVWGWTWRTCGPRCVGRGEGQTRVLGSAWAVELEKGGGKRGGRSRGAREARSGPGPRHLHQEGVGARGCGRCPPRAGWAQGWVGAVFEGWWGHSRPAHLEEHPAATGGRRQRWAPRQSWLPCKQRITLPRGRSWLCLEPTPPPHQGFFQLAFLGSPSPCSLSVSPRDDTL